MIEFCTATCYGNSLSSLIEIGRNPYKYTKRELQEIIGNSITDLSDADRLTSGTKNGNNGRHGLSESAPEMSLHFYYASHLEMVKRLYEHFVR
jgi:hypothetical protein